MPTRTPSAAPPRFCSNCGTQLNPGASFCHMCGSPTEGAPSAAQQPQPSGRSDMLRLGVPALAFLALLILTAVQFGSRNPQPTAAGGMPLGAGPISAPDISSMSPQERADRLFNRVMLLASEGKADSALFFAPMAVGAIEALAPLDAHQRYDLGLVALVMSDASRANSEAEAILAEQPTHLLGLLLAARAAESRRDARAAADFRRRLAAAESAERARGLPEYTDHDADIRAALESVGRP